jgi:TPP-dependent trihydroxycyclohexane-1,2-dione (THcHDO) dehydratase
MTRSTTQETVRLTVAQAVVRFLAAQWTEPDGERQKPFAGCFGIFGHGNVAGVDQALLEAAAPDALPIVIHVETDPLVHAPDSEAWWDVPVSKVSELDSTQDAYETYSSHKATQRALITPTISSTSTEDPR